jgi:hypothetical protein
VAPVARDSRFGQESLLLAKREKCPAASRRDPLQFLRPWFRLKRSDTGDNQWKDTRAADAPVAASTIGDESGSVGRKTASSKIALNGIWDRTVLMSSLPLAIPPFKLSALVREWLSEDVPSFDFAGAVVGDGVETAVLYCKAQVRINTHCRDCCL